MSKNTNAIKQNIFLSDTAKYLKGLMPSNMPDVYSLKSMFTSISSEEDLRNGILALKDFMSQLYDLLIEDSKKYEKPKSMNDKTNRNPSLAVDFPFIYHTRSVLLNIGYYSTLNEDVLTFSGLNTLTPIICCEGMLATTKISGPKLMDCLRFLNDCGMCFEGFELDTVKPNMTSNKLIEVTYPDNPSVLTGLKIMAVAQRELQLKTNDDIFLRCDYRALTNDETDVTDTLKDFINPFSSEIQEFILHLNKKCLQKGLKCKVKIGLQTSFLYAHKKNALWELSSSLAYGYRIFVKALYNHLYLCETTAFSPVFQKIIDNGSGCERKRFCKPCEKDCHGFSVPLDDSILDISRDIEVWIDNELSCLSSK